MLMLDIAWGSLAVIGFGCAWWMLSVVSTAPSGRLYARTNDRLRVQEILNRASYHRRRMHELLEYKWSAAHAYHFEQLEAEAEDLVRIEGLIPFTPAAEEMETCVFDSVPYDEAKARAYRELECGA